MSGFLGVENLTVLLGTVESRGGGDLADDRHGPDAFSIESRDDALRTPIVIKHCGARLTRVVRILFGRAPGRALRHGFSRYYARGGLCR